jgi:hypothetical protein
VPILTLQRQFRELGRIRAGDSEPPAPGKTFRRPKKLATFRLTSASQTLIERVAAEYGGKAQRWANAPEGTGAQWECTITADALDVMVPPGQTYSQWMELWKGGGCARRCDGIRELLHDTPCLCPDDPKERTALAAKGEACKPTTRFVVMLPKIPDIGAWRVETHSYYAALELAGTLDILSKATEAGWPLPAQLRIEQRSKKRPGEGRKDFPVIVLSLPDRFAGELLVAPASAVAIGPGPSAPMLTAGGRPDIPHAPEPRGIEAPAVARTEDGRAVDADGVIEGHATEGGPALFEDEPPRIPTPQEIRDAADTAGIDVVALAGRLFPAWATADPRRPLNESERVALMAEVKGPAGSTVAQIA